MNEDEKQTDEEYEIRVDGVLILKGDNLDELITSAKLMYPDKAIGIRKSRKNVWRNS